MKKQVLFIITTFMFVLISQAQITLNQSNTSFTPGNIIAVEAGVTGFTLPTIGANQLWNYSGLVAGNIITDQYVAFPNSNFPNATYADTTNSATFIPNWYYYYNSYIQTSASGANSLGYTVKDQRYGVTMLGNPNDSCNFPAQVCVYSSPSYIMPFPSTMNTSWQTSVRSFVNFNLTLNSYSLINVPCQKVTNTLRKDTVISWGKMRVPTLTGPSLAYDVLMFKRMVLQTDSFYMNGSPAPPALLMGFGVTQGQSKVDNRYMFWRENARYPLLMVNFGTDNFTTASSIYFDGTAVADPISVLEINQMTDQSFYPNPASYIIYLNLKYSSNEKLTLNIYNITGKLNRTEILQQNQQQINVEELKNGVYIVEIKSNSGTKNQKIIIQK